jgi:hypothetical protein
MKIFLQNTETQQTFDLQYLPVEIDWGGNSNKFAAADIPQMNAQPQYWQMGTNATRAIDCTLEGDDAIDRLQQIEQWTKAIVGKFSPPVCVLNVGVLVEWVVLVSVAAKMPLLKFAGEQPTRISLTINYLVVPMEEIA